MSVFETVRNALSDLANRIAGRRRPDFICNDCDRWERCGLPPDADCAASAAQLEQRDRDGYRPRYAGNVLPFRPPFEIRDHRKAG